VQHRFGFDFFPAVFERVAVGVHRPQVIGIDLSDGGAGIALDFLAITGFDR